MITLSIISCFLGFEFFYQTSKKAILSRPDKMAAWINSNEKTAQSLGGTLLLSSLALTIFHLGIGAGFFAFACVLMMVGSFVVLISPIWKLNGFWLVAGFGLMFIIEML